MAIVAKEETKGWEAEKGEYGELYCKVECDGPNCHRSDSACKGTMEWVEKSVKTGSHGVPDDAFRIIFVTNFQQSVNLSFFSRECLKEYMRGYVPPLSPHEQAEMAKAAQETPPLTPETIGVGKQP